MLEWHIAIPQEAPAAECGCPAVLEITVPPSATLDIPEVLTARSLDGGWAIALGALAPGQRRLLALRLCVPALAPHTVLTVRGTLRGELHGAIAVAVQTLRVVAETAASGEAAVESLPGDRECQQAG
jgi:hypothetical protein